MTNKFSVYGPNRRKNSQKNRYSDGMIADGGGCPPHAAGFSGLILAAALALFGYSSFANSLPDTYANRPPEEAFERKLNYMETQAEYHLKRITRLQRDARDAIQQIQKLEDEIQRLDEEIKFINDRGRPMRHSDRPSHGGNGR